MVYAAIKFDFGVADHGVWEDLRGRWACEPIIRVWPKRIPLYLADHNSRSQELICEVEDVDYNPNNGKCRFLPRVFATYADQDDAEPSKEYVSDTPSFENYRYKGSVTYQVEFMEIWGVTDAYTINQGFSSVNVFWIAGFNMTFIEAKGSPEDQTYTEYWPEMNMKVVIIIDGVDEYIVFNDIV